MVPDERYRPHCWFIDFWQRIIYVCFNYYPMRYSNSIAIVYLILTLANLPSLALGQVALDDTVPAQPRSYRSIFDDVETGILDGNVALLERHFSSHITLSLRGGESGSFSSSQSYYVLENFLRHRKFRRFELALAGEGDGNPYGAGTAEFIHDGKKEFVQVYVALTLDGDQLRITQLTIY
jgi:hypothetical protein